MPPSIPFAFLILGLFGCTGDSPKSVVASGGPDNPTWTHDIQPMVEQHCVRCHKADGLGTGSFDDYESVVAMSEVMHASMARGDMPPPAADPDCRDYEGSDILHLPDEKMDMFAKWIELGTPYGDEADLRDYESTEYVLEDADLEVMMQAPYQARFAGENPLNEYRCFALPHGRDEAFYITALHPIVDNEKMSHHVIIGTAPSDQVVPGSFSPEGADCIEGGGGFATGEDQTLLGGWAPGMRPVFLPEGTGIRVEPDHAIIMQLHYYKSDLTESESVDYSGMAFKTAETVETELFMFPVGTTEFTIPAGASAYTKERSFIMPYGFKIWGSIPHMHSLGTGYSFSVSHGGEEHCVVQSDRYDFDNQQNYLFKEPLVAPANSLYQWSCRWNNSTSNPNLIIDPPQDVGYGEGSEEEMCFMFPLFSRLD